MKAEGEQTQEQDSSDQTKSCWGQGVYIYSTHEFNEKQVLQGLRREEWREKGAGLSFSTNNQNEQKTQETNLK